jgi:hypothetical protein
MLSLKYVKENKNLKRVVLYKTSLEQISVSNRLAVFILSVSQLQHAFSCNQQIETRNSSSKLHLNMDCNNFDNRSHGHYR